MLAKDFQLSCLQPVKTMNCRILSRCPRLSEFMRGIRGDVAQPTTRAPGPLFAQYSGFHNLPTGQVGRSGQVRSGVVGRVPTPQPLNPCRSSAFGAWGAPSGRRSPSISRIGERHGWRALARCVMRVASVTMAQEHQKHVCSPDGGGSNGETSPPSDCHPLVVSLTCMHAFCSHSRASILQTRPCTRLLPPCRCRVCACGNPCTLMRVLPCVLQVVGLPFSRAEFQQEMGLLACCTA